jgi:epoxyqueuosine reductase
MMSMSLEQEIKDKALALGFDAAGITDASPISPEHVGHFEAWLRSGYAGRMDYMHRNIEKRANPAKLLKGAQSVIVVAINYKPPESIADCGLRIADSRPDSNPVGRVAQYAQYEDYHPFIKSLLRELADFIQARTDQTQRFRICVDSAPLAEKALAVRAGLGFIGKSHLLIHPQLGPQVLLGELITTLSLRPDEPIGGSCGACDRCLRACPAGALRPDGFLDASRCISYLTQYGSQEESAGRTGKWIFGCDECLLACPLQQSAPAHTNPHFRRYPERATLNLREVLEWTKEEFEARFHDSPTRRLGFETLRRNARRCLESDISGMKKI